MKSGVECSLIFLIKGAMYGVTAYVYKEKIKILVLKKVLLSYFCIKYTIEFIYFSQSLKIVKICLEVHMNL